jgi:hypothetical protein
MRVRVVWSFWSDSDSRWRWSDVARVHHARADWIKKYLDIPAAGDLFEKFKRDYGQPPRDLEFRCRRD